MNHVSAWAPPHSRSMHFEVEFPSVDEISRHSVVYGARPPLSFSCFRVTSHIFMWLLSQLSFVFAKVKDEDYSHFSYVHQVLTVTTLLLSYRGRDACQREQQFCCPILGAAKKTQPNRYPIQLHCRASWLLGKSYYCQKQLLEDLNRSGGWSSISFIYRAPNETRIHRFNV